MTEEEKATVAYVENLAGYSNAVFFALKALVQILSHEQKNAFFASFRRIHDEARANQTVFFSIPPSSPDDYLEGFDLVLNSLLDERSSFSQ